MLEVIVQKALLDSAKQLIDDMGIEQLCDTLMNFPTQISAKNSRIIEIQKLIVGLEIQVINAQGTMDQEKAVAVAEVATEVNGEGKPRFSNDKSRDAEVTKRLSVNDEYREAKATVDSLKGQIGGFNFDIQALRHEIGKLESQMANFRVVVSARTAQIQALFGGQV